jgi:hypothetical protein
MAEAMAEDGGSRVPMSSGLQATLLRAREYAASQSEAEVLLEHLLLALSEDADAATVLESCQIDLSRLRRDVAGYIGSLDDRVPAGTAGAPAISATLTQVLKYATLAAQQGRRTSIDGAIVLAALVGDGRSMAASFLKAQGLTFEAAIRALSDVAARSQSTPARQTVHRPADPTAAEPFPRSAPSAGRAQGPNPPRTEDILARARERVESRSPRTEPPSRAPRNGPPAPEPVPSAPTMSEPLAPMPAAETRPSGDATIPSAEPAPRAAPEVLPMHGLQAAAAAAAAAAPEALSPISRPAPMTPPTPGMAPSGREQRPSDGFGHRPPGELPGAAQAQEPQATPPHMPPRPLPPHLPRPEPGRPGPVGDISLYPENRIAPRRPVAPGQNAHAPPAGGWPGRPSQPGPGQPRSVNEADAGPQRASRAPPGRAAWSESPHLPTPPVSPASPAVERRAAPPQPAIDATMVSHSIPTRLKQGRAHVIEVRIDRPAMAPVSGPPRSYALRPESVVARAIAVRLRPLAGRFIIDALSPETQWDQTGAGGGGRLTPEAAVWRFSVTPVGSGRGVLQLAVSARTLGADGVLAETQLPEQSYDVRVAAGYGGLVGRVGKLVLIGGAGMVLLKLVEGMLRLDLGVLARHLLGF